MTTTNMGSEGFQWFVGKVEDLEDPKQLGRVRVRVFGEHDANVNTEDLPWAIIMMPAYSASAGAVGLSPTGIQINALCFGFWLDGREKQKPMLIGTWHKQPGGKENPEIHDVAKLARGIQSIKDDPIAPGDYEPGLAYKAKYPHNKVLQTTSGHVVEIDDTPNEERLHIRHKSGTYVEIDKNGRVVIKTVGNRHDLTKGNSMIYVQGNVSMQIDGNCNQVVKGKTTITSQGDLTMGTAGVLNLWGGQGINFKSGTSTTFQSPGGVTITSGGLSVMGAITSAVGVSGTFSTPTGKRVSVNKGMVSNITDA